MSGNPSSDAGHNSVELCDLLKKNMKGGEGDETSKRVSVKRAMHQFFSLSVFLLVMGI